jgi:hypothetical protein
MTIDERVTPRTGPIETGRASPRPAARDEAVVALEEPDSSEVATPPVPLRSAVAALFDVDRSTTLLPPTPT